MLTEKSLVHPDISMETKEDLTIIKSVEAGTFTSIQGSERDRLYSQLSVAAKNTLAIQTQRKSINLRVIASDIDKIKALAMNQGVPYKTLLTSLIHKVASGQIKP